MGGGTYLSTLVNRLLRDAKEQQTLAAHGGCWMRKAITCD
jgi:hypothetical protein